MRSYKRLTVFVLSLVLAGSVASANSLGDFRSAATQARESLLTLLKDPSKRGPDQQKLVKDTADQAQKILDGLKAPAGKEKEFNEMKEAWVAFKKTRENELVPAILAGKQADAEKIATGIQRERMKTVMDRLDAIQGKDL